MSTPKEPGLAKLFLSILFSGGTEPTDSAEVTEALAGFEKEYGTIDILSPVLPFNYTAYYQREMGEHLWRRALSFERLVQREQLVDIKLFCHELEQKHLNAAGHRRLNLDPGLITPENFILATGKNIAHRIYLARGIYADLTLIYHSKRFNPLPWTYPDYASAEITALLVQMRERLLEAMRAKDALR